MFKFPQLHQQSKDASMRTTVWSKQLDWTWPDIEKYTKLYIFKKVFNSRCFKSEKLWHITSFFFSWKQTINSSVCADFVPSMQKEKGANNEIFILKQAIRTNN